MSVVGLQFSGYSEEFCVGVVVDLNGLRQCIPYIPTLPTEYNVCAEYTGY